MICPKYEVGSVNYYVFKDKETKDLVVSIGKIICLRICKGKLSYCFVNQNICGEVAEEDIFHTFSDAIKRLNKINKPQKASHDNI